MVSDGDFWALYNRVTSLETRMNDAESRLNSVENRATQLENRATSIERRDEFVRRLAQFERSVLNFIHPNFTPANGFFDVKDARRIMLFSQYDNCNRHEFAFPNEESVLPNDRDSLLAIQAKFQEVQGVMDYNKLELLRRANVEFPHDISVGGDLTQLANYFNNTEQFEFGAALVWLRSAINHFDD